MLYRDNIIYVDPIDDKDVLTAMPAGRDGVVFATIGVTHGVDLGEGHVINSGHSQSICVQPGHEKAVLCALGDRLLGVSGDDKTVVATIKELEALREELKAQYRHTYTVCFVINDLIDRLIKRRGQLPTVPELTITS